MQRALFIFTIALGFSSVVWAADMSEPGSDHYNCPGSGHSDSAGAFKNDGTCGDECKTLVFDCSKHQLMVNGKPLPEDGDPESGGSPGWLGCAKQTGTTMGGRPHKLKQESDGCGRGDAGHLPTNEPKLESDILPCGNCVIHRMTKGAETAGCLGLEAKLFDFVYKKCGGCSYTIIPEGGAGASMPEGNPKQPTSDTSY